MLNYRLFIFKFTEIREKTVEYSISTASLYVRYLSCWFDSPSYDSIVFEFYIENIDSLLNYKSYLVDTDWNYYDGDWKNKKEVIKEFPPEETLDLIAKAWELAGIMVDKRL